MSVMYGADDSMIWVCADTLTSQLKSHLMVLMARQKIQTERMGLGKPNEKSDIWMNEVGVTVRFKAKLGSVNRRVASQNIQM